MVWAMDWACKSMRLPRSGKIPLPCSRPAWYSPSSPASTCPAGAETRQLGCCLHMANRKPKTENREAQGEGMSAEDGSRIPSPIDVRTIRDLVGLMSRHDLSEIDLRDGDLRIRLRRGPQGTFTAAGPAA